MLEVSNLGFDYPERPLLQNIHFSTAPGAILHIKGENGAGKTTLLKLLAGILRAHEGEIYFNGQDIQSDLKTYHQQICFIGHRLGISQYLSIRENYLTSLSDQTVIEFEHAIEKLSLKRYENIPCAYLSMGQKRKASLIKLFLSQASLWFLDEPFIALDTLGMTLLKDCIDRHLAKNGQVILTSHQEIPFKHYQEYSL